MVITPVAGTSGHPCTVVSNYFKLKQSHNYVLYQYHVDYAPECVNPRTRIGLLNEHKELLGPDKAFDGMLLVLPRKLERDVSEREFIIDM